MTDTEVALVLPEAGEVGLLEQDGEAAGLRPGEPGPGDAAGPSDRRGCVHGVVPEAGCQGVPAELEVVAAFLAHEPRGVS